MPHPRIGHEPSVNDGIAFTVSGIDHKGKQIGDLRKAVRTLKQRKINMQKNSLAIHKPRAGIGSFIIRPPVMRKNFLFTVKFLEKALVHDPRHR